MSRAVPRFKRVNPPLPAYAFPIYLLTLSGLVQAQRWVCNFTHLAAAAGQTAASESNIATSWLNTCLTLFRACIGTDVTTDSLKVTCVSAPTRQPFLNGTNVNFGNGTGNGVSVDSELACVYTKYTSVKGQHGRGRNYLPGVPTGAIQAPPNQSLLTNAQLNAVNAFLATLASPLIVDGATQLQPGVYTRVPKGQAVTNAATITQFLPRQLIGVVRRRRIGRGK